MTEEQIKAKKLWIKIVAAVVMTPLVLLNVLLFQWRAWGAGALLLFLNISLFRMIRDRHELIGDENVQL